MTPELHRELHLIAQERGESMALLAREALQLYLARHGAVEEGRAAYPFPAVTAKKSRKIP